jgi:hypothetical protein
MLTNFITFNSNIKNKDVKKGADTSRLKDYEKVKENYI